MSEPTTTKQKTKPNRTLKLRGLPVVKLVRQLAAQYAFKLPDSHFKRRKDGRGRPTIMTENTLRKLEEGFAYDSTVEEACIGAGITPFTYYEFLKKYPHFSKTVELLRGIPTAIARRTVIAGIVTSQDHAFKYLERKVKKEFSPKFELGHSGGIRETHEVSPGSRKAIDNLRQMIGDKTIKTTKGYEADEDEDGKGD